MDKEWIARRKRELRAEKDKLREGILRIEGALLLLDEVAQLLQGETEDSANVLGGDDGR